jgi:hypothetical protein
VKANNRPEGFVTPQSKIILQRELPDLSLQRHQINHFYFVAVGAKNVASALEQLALSIHDLLRR